jgi:hypothetical protein
MRLQKNSKKKKRYRIFKLLNEGLMDAVKEELKKKRDTAYLNCLMRALWMRLQKNSTVGPPDGPASAGRTTGSL